MQINSYNNVNPSFGMIKLNSKELQRSEELIKILTKSKLSSAEKQEYALDLYNFFEPHLKNEGIQKAKKIYLTEDVISDIKLKFWEFVYNINRKNVLNDLISQINEYKPDKILLKPEYLNKSLNEKLSKLQSVQRIDYITKDNLPVPQSKIEIDEIKQKLTTTIQKTKMSSTAKSRLKARGKGMTYKKIAEKQGVGKTAVANSINKSILKIQDKNNTISEENRIRIMQTAEAIGVTFDKMLRMAKKNIQIISTDFEILKRKIKIAPELLGITRKRFIKAGLNDPTVFLLKPETIDQKARIGSKLTGISKSDYTELLLLHPKSCGQNPETLNKNLETTAKLLETTKQQLIKLAKKQVAVIYQKPETINNNAEMSSKLLGIAKKEFTEAGFANPQVFCKKPETLNKNAQTCSKLIGTTKKEFVKAELLRPQLFSSNPKTINENVKTSAKLLGISKEAFVEAALKQPQLFYQKPETLNKNAQTSAELLGITKEEFVNIALKQVSWFYQKPETLQRKLKIVNYARKLKNEPSKVGIPSRRVMTSEDKLYKDILAYIMQKKCYPELTKESIIKRLPELLNSYKGTITAEIPESDVASDFIKFVQDYSVKTTGKNIFNLNTASNK